MKPRRPKTLTLTFDVNPHESAARMALSVVPDGYRFVSMVRRGTKAKVTYRRCDARLAQAAKKLEG